MTETDAFLAYMAHLRACPVCAAVRQAACSTGLELHDNWKDIEAKQAVA